ncbi:MAG: dihydroorotase [Leptolyngbya sp. SIO1D8]|nr:dihydroorotase [Leptolyngbya sp. SIO1D8]
MVGTLLRQVRLLDPASQTDQVMDVLMVDEVFQAIAPALPEPSTDVNVIDATGQVLAPGLVDLYSHSSEPGNESRETLADLMTGAIAGGVTRLGILPNTVPPLEHPGAIRYLLDLACELPVTPQPFLLPWAALTQGTLGQQMTELAELARLQQVALAGFCDGCALNNPVLLRRLLEYLRPLNCLVALWPCDQALTGNGIAREGSVALMGGLPGSPIAAETVALATLLELVREIGTPVHIMRVSTARSVELIAQAKSQGLPITASTTWMHLLFSTHDVLSYDPNLRLEPPVGNQIDQIALAHGVKTGVIDAIAIDHSPYTYEEKTVAFRDAPPGAIGLELAFATLWQRFIISGEWPALTLLKAMSLNPAKCLGITSSNIAVGRRVEAFLFNPATVWTVEPSTLRSPACNTPFLGQSLSGKVVQVWIELG